MQGRDLRRLNTFLFRIVYAKLVGRSGDDMRPGRSIKNSCNFLQCPHMWREIYSTNTDSTTTVYLKSHTSPQTISSSSSNPQPPLRASPPSASQLPDHASASPSAQAQTYKTASRTQIPHSTPRSGSTSLCSLRRTARAARRRCSRWWTEGPQVS